MKTLLLLAGGAIVVWLVLDLAKKQEQSAPTQPITPPPAPGFNPRV